MGKTNQSAQARNRRKMHIRKSVRGTAARPRLTVFRSANHIYAQVINDETGITIASASTMAGDGAKVKGHKGNKDAAAKVGTDVAKKAIKAGVESVCFDRNGYLYHGRVQALADAAREAGLKF